MNGFPNFADTRPIAGPRVSRSGFR
jgi:hypothetical protein